MPINSIQIWGYHDLEGQITRNGYFEHGIFISIRDCDKENRLFPNESERALPLFFWDVDPTLPLQNYERRDMHMLEETGQFFCEEYANQIFDFIDKWKNSPEEVNLHINCEAGISRSGAVGTVLREYLDLDEQMFRVMNRGINPNAYIMAIMRQRFQGVTQ